MNKKSALIFDMDGVLFDTERVYLESCQRAASGMGLGDVGELCLSCIGITAEMTRRRFLEYFGDEEILRSFWGEAGRITRETLDREIPLKPGAREILVYLRERDIPTALASSTRTEIVRRELTQTGLIDHFSVIVGGDAVKNSKPHPEIFLKAAELLEKEPGECIIIEDSVNGIRAAEAAGITALLIPDLMIPEENIVRRAYAAVDSLFEAMELLEMDFGI